MIINSENWNELSGSDKLLIVDFSAEWCHACKAIAPIINDLAEKYVDRACVGQCDVEENNDIAEKYSIRHVPTLLFIKKGDVVERLTGTFARETLEETIEKHL